MLDGIIHALASYERVERARETPQGIDDRRSCHDLEITASPELMQLLAIKMSDGRFLFDHLVEARALYRDLNNIGRA